MPHHLNHLGQPTGEPLLNWTSRLAPPREAMAGRYCRVEMLDADRHGPELFAANSAEADGRMWTYLPYGPFGSPAEYIDWMRSVCAGNDPLFHAIIDLRTQTATGVAGYLRIDRSNGVIEVGHIAYSPALQQTAAATEAMYLMMRRAFELGYRRYEWKCDALNAPSRKAAERLGFTFEGLFRQAVVYKNRSRDTAWYSIIDKDWPALRGAFERWLDPENFDGDGKQRERLSDLIGAIRGSRAAGSEAEPETR